MFSYFLIWEYLPIYLIDWLSGGDLNKKDKYISSMMCSSGKGNNGNNILHDTEGLGVSNRKYEQKHHDCKHLTINDKNLV